MNKTHLFVLLFGVVCCFSCNEKTKTYTAKERKTYHENLIKANKELVAQDQEKIELHVQRNAWNMLTTPTGLWYQIVKSTDNKKAKAGQIAHLRFEVSLLNGTLCYSSDSTGIKQFKIGQGGVEAGLEEGILLLKEGEAARFIMPPHLAYSLLGDENKIPPRSTIVYNVELLKLTD